MGEFLGSIHLNKNKDLIISSSNLTFEKWNGYVAYIPNSSISEYYTPIAVENNNSKSTPTKQQQTRSKRELKLVTASVNNPKSGEDSTTTTTNGKDESIELLSNMLRYKTGITRAKWALDNEHFLAASEMGHIELFRYRGGVNERGSSKEDGSPQAAFESVMYAREHDSLIGCLETRLDDGFALTGSNDCKIKIWDLKEQMSTRTYKAHEDVVCGLSLNQSDSNMFISCSLDGSALLWDTRKPKPAFSIEHGLNGYASCASWSKTHLIALGSETGQIGIYDIRAIANTNKPLSLNQSHSRLVRRLEFNAADLVASASEDCTTCVFKVVEPSVLTDTSLVRKYSFKHNDYVTDLAWLSSDEYLTCSWDGTLRHHRIASDAAAAATTNGNGVKHEN